MIFKYDDFHSMLLSSLYLPGTVLYRNLETCVKPFLFFSGLMVPSSKLELERVDHRAGHVQCRLEVLHGPGEAQQLEVEDPANNGRR